MRVEVYEVVARSAKERGITVSELGRRTDINHVLLRNSLHGKRGLRADELVKLSRELGLEMSDFAEVA